MIDEQKTAIFCERRRKLMDGNLIVKFAAELFKTAAEVLANYYGTERSVSELCDFSDSE